MQLEKILFSANFFNNCPIQQLQFSKMFTLSQSDGYEKLNSALRFIIQHLIQLSSQILVTRTKAFSYLYLPLCCNFIYHRAPRGLNLQLLASNVIYDCITLAILHHDFFRHTSSSWLQQHEQWHQQVGRPTAAVVTPLLGKNSTFLLLCNYPKSKFLHVIIHIIMALLQIYVCKELPFLILCRTVLAVSQPATETNGFSIVGNENFW